MAWGDPEPTPPCRTRPTWPWWRRVQQDLHPCVGQLRFEVADGFLEFFLAGNALGKEELPPKFDWRSNSVTSAPIRACSKPH